MEFMAMVKVQFKELMLVSYDNAIQTGIQEILKSIEGVRGSKALRLQNGSPQNRGL